MKIKDLEYFITIAQSSSISEAAQRLYIAQPSLTKAIQRLEEEIGAPLFDRRRDGVTLTEAGRKILPQARQVVEYYTEWLSLGRQNELKGLNIYVGRAFSDMFLPRILINFRQRYPELPINFQTIRNPDSFISRSTQLPTISIFACEKQAMETCAEMQGCSPIILMRGEYHCLISRLSPLAQRESVSLAELKDHILVLPGAKIESTPAQLSGPKVTAAILSTAPSNRVVTVESLANVIAQAAENPQTYATAFYPALLRYPQVQSGALVSVPFREFREPINLCLFYSRHAYQRHPIVAELVDAIREAFHTFSESLEV